MVLDPIPQSAPVHFFGSRPQPPTSPQILVGDIVIMHIHSLAHTNSLSHTHTHTHTHTRIHTHTMKLRGNPRDQLQTTARRYSWEISILIRYTHSHTHTHTHKHTHIRTTKHRGNPGISRKQMRTDTRGRYADHTQTHTLSHTHIHTHTYTHVHTHTM